MQEIIALAALSPLIVVFVACSFKAPVDFLLPAYAIFVPFGSGLNVPGLSGSLGSPSSVLGLLLILSLGYGYLFGAVQAPVPPAATGVWLLFLGYAGLSTAWSIDAGLTATGCFIFASLLLLYVLLRAFPVSQEQLRRTENAIMLGGVATALFGLAQLATSTTPSGGGTARLGEELIDPNHTAAALVLPLAIALGRLSAPGMTRTRILAALALIVMLSADVITGSRSGMLAAMLAAALVAMGGRQRVRALVAGFVLMCVLIATFALSPLSLPERLSSESSSGRSDIWRVGLQACQEYCVAGAGWNTFGLLYAQTLPEVADARVSPNGSNYQPHNIFLLVLLETGLIGLSLTVVAIALIIRESLQLPVQVRGPPLGALAGLLFTGLFIGNIEFKYWWLVLIYVGMVHSPHGHAARVRGNPRSAPLEFHNR